MFESLIQRALRFKREAISHAKKLEKNKFLLYLIPSRQKKYYICLAVIKCVDQLLDQSKCNPSPFYEEKYLASRDG